MIKELIHWGLSEMIYNISGRQLACLSLCKVFLGYCNNYPIIYYCGYFMLEIVLILNSLDKSSGFLNLLFSDFGEAIFRQQLCFEFLKSIISLLCTLKIREVAIVSRFEGWALMIKELSHHHIVWYYFNQKICWSVYSTSKKENGREPAS